MSELKRKYVGLKQAHKELSVEVVTLRARIGELEEQAHTDANVAQQMVAKYKGRSDRYLKALKWLEKQFNWRSKKVVFNKECYEVITTALAKEAGDTVAECEKEEVPENQYTSIVVDGEKIR